jgi:hypothetical protein
VIALLAAGGLVLVALGNNETRLGNEDGQFLFWGGLAAIYAPIAFRLFSAGASRAERVALVVTLGLALYLVRVLASPAEFVRFDELGTWRATDDLLKSGRYFASNPLVISTEGFPGLEAVTAALADLSGSTIFQAGVTVIAAARLALVIALFVFLERVSGSARAAGIGVAVYACNPSFLYFDAQFAYESLALAIAAALLLMTLMWANAERGSERFPVAIVALAWALTLTHHMTAAATLAFLSAWAVLEWRASGTWRSMPGFAAGALGVAMLIWFTLVAGGVTVDELGSVFSGMVDSAVNLISGDSGPKTLFEGGGENNSLLLRALAFVSVVPLLALLPFGIWRAWQARGLEPLWGALALVGVIYPLTLALRLTAGGSETSQRASEFAFVGMAFFAAILVTRVGWPTGLVRRTALATGLSAVATVVFLGGFVIGELPATRQPGPFLVGADARSITPQGHSAAEFVAEHLPPDSRFLSDRSNAMLVASYGGADLVLGRTREIPVPHVFFGERFGDFDRTVIRDHEVEYILVDRRLRRGVPVIGFYIENDEPRAYAQKGPVSVAALRKFAQVRGLRPVFKNGPITIYDTSAVLSR